MKTITLHSIVFTLFTLTLFSCSKEKEVPANVIEDASGVKIMLEWNTGADFATSLSDADLDIYLRHDSSEVGKSESSNSFELIELADTLSDSDYTLNVNYYKGLKNVTYNVTVSGKSTNKTYKVSSEFVATEDNALKTDVANHDILKISKKGTKYILSKM